MHVNRSAHSPAVDSNGTDDTHILGTFDGTMEVQGITFTPYG